jgi:hypothetical protein
VKLIVDRLRQDGDIETGISPNFLVRNWPPAFTEWSTRSVRDAFFASPQFPRLLNGDAIKDTIARGVSGGMLAYVGKSGDSYNPFVFQTSISAEEVEISEDMFIVTADEAKKHIEPPRLTHLLIRPERPTVKPGGYTTFQVEGLDQHGRPMDAGGVAWSAKGAEMDDKGCFKAGKDEGEYLVEAAVGDLHAQTTVVISKEEPPPPPPPSEPKDQAKGLRWSGDVPAQKWMNFYTKVLAKYATAGEMKLTVSVEVRPEDGLATHKLEETKASLRELGLNDDVDSLS